MQDAMNSDVDLTRIWDLADRARDSIGDAEYYLNGILDMLRDLEAES